MKYIFTDLEFQAELKKELEHVLAHQRSLAAPTQLVAGAMFGFPESSAPVRWVAAVQHRTQPRYWYFVIADELPLLGSHDIELTAEQQNGLLVARCDLGVWADEKDVDLQHFLGQLSPESVAAIQSGIKSLDAQSALARTQQARIESLTETRARDPLSSLELQMRTAMDGDPEYCQWKDELTAIVRQVERRLGKSWVTQSDLTAATAAEPSSFATVAEQSATYARAEPAKAEDD
jgi:hypothetical protein